MRDRILESSVQPWLALKNEQLRGRLMIKFHGEEGKDWGGLFKVHRIPTRIDLGAQDRTLRNPDPVGRLGMDCAHRRSAAP